MSDLPTHKVRFADLPNRKRSTFLIEPQAPARKAMAEAIGVLGIKKLRVEGTLEPLGKRDWRIEANLGATVQQACVVTLEPVTTRIDEQFERTYIAEFEYPQAAEIEMPEDDASDPLPDTLDLIDVVLETLMLNLPPYPRKEDAPSDVIAVTEPGKAVMTDEDARPFAKLAEMRAALEKKNDDDA